MRQRFGATISLGKKQIDSGDRDFSPAERAAGFEAPLAGDKTTFGRDNHRMEQPDLGDAVGKCVQIAEIFAVSGTRLRYSAPGHSTFGLFPTASSFRPEQAERRNREQLAGDTFGDTVAFVSKSPTYGLGKRIVFSELCHFVSPYL